MYFHKNMTYKRVEVNSYKQFRVQFEKGVDPYFIKFNEKNIGTFIKASEKNYVESDKTSVFLNAFFNVYERKITENSKKAVVDLLRLAILTRCGLAYYELGMLFDKGLIVRQNPKMSFQFFQNALAFGDKKAYMQLALMYYFGKGVERDYETAAKYFEFAANKLHDANARVYVQTSHILSKFTNAQEKEDAIHALILLSNKGNEFAHYALGNIYLTRYGKYDYKKATYHFKQIQTPKYKASVKEMLQKLHSQLNS